MLYYQRQVSLTQIDNATLTADYADNRKEMTTRGMSKLSLDIDYARGSGEASSKLLITLESSADRTYWSNLVIDATSATSVISAREWEIEDTAHLNILVDIAYEHMRVSVKESGVSTNDGTVTVRSTLSGQ